MQKYKIFPIYPRKNRITLSTSMLYSKTRTCNFFVRNLENTLFLTKHNNVISSGLKASSSSSLLPLLKSGKTGWVEWFFIGRGCPVGGILFFRKKSCNFAVEKTYNEPMKDKHNSLNITPPHQSHSKTCQSQNTLGNVKKFLKDVGVVLSVVILLLIGLEMMLGIVPRELKYKDWYLVHRGDCVQTLILGNSFLARGLDPHVLGDSTFNCASTARTLVYDSLILHKYYSHLPNLKTIILPTHYGLHFAPHHHSEVRFRYARYMKLFTDENYYEYSALLSGCMQMKTYKPGKIDSTGFMPIRRVWDGVTIANPPESVNAIAARASRYTSMMEHIADFCRKKNIRLIILIPPLSDTFLDCGSDSLWKLQEDVVAEIKNKFPVEVGDYLRHKDFRSNEMYCDEIHLNHAGASLFSTLVKKDFEL